MQPCKWQFCFLISSERSRQRSWQSKPFLTSGELLTLLQTSSLCMAGCKRGRLRLHIRAALLLVLCLLTSAARAKQLAMLVQPLSSLAGEPLSLQPVVALTDDSGNILTSESDGTVSVSIGNNPSRFAVMWPTGNTFAFVNGIAHCSGLYIKEAATGYTLVLSSFYHGVRTETSSFDVVVGPRFRLAILADISTAYGGTPFLPQPTAGVVDKGGNVVTATNEGTVRVEIEVNPVGGLLLPAAVLNTSIVSGIARFRGVFIDVAGSPYKLRYTTDLVLDGGNTVVTNPFTVAQGVCNKVVIMNAPTAAKGGKAFSIQPVLKLIDSGGNTLEADSSSLVRVSIAANPSRGALKPTDALIAYVRKGFAVFRGLKIDKAGSGYSLRFTVYNKVEGKNQWKKLDIQNVTGTFDVLMGTPVSLYLQRNLSDGVLDGQPNEVQPVVALLDSGGNVVSSLETGSITAAMVSSASVSSSIVVDTSAAPFLTVSSVRAVTSASYPMPYGVGARVSIQVTFSDEVAVKGAPTLELASSTGGVGANGNAVCTAASSVWSTVYVFEYDVVATDSTADLEYTSTTALSLNGGTITDRNGKPPILTLPALGSTNSLSGTSAVVIDTASPVITAVTCTNPGNGDFGTGQQIYLKVQFSQPVAVYGSPLLPMALTTVGSGGTRNAVFFSGNNTNILVFLYTVQNGDATSTLDVTANVDVNGGFIKHFSQRPITDAIVTMSTVPTKLSSANNIAINTAVPTIDATVGVTSASSDGIYAPGDELSILITFTKPVVVTGYPRLFLETGPIKRPAGYFSGSGSKVLTFVYRVSTGDTSGGGFLNYRDAQALSLNGGTITRYLVGSSGMVGPPAVISLADSTIAGKALMNNAHLTIDGLPPTVTGITVSSAPSTTVTRDNEVVISISFSALVTVDTTKGTPSLQMAVGDYNREAVHTSGNNTQALLFSYIVRLGDEAPNGVNYRSQSALVLNGGTIRRASMSPTLDAYLTLPDPPSLSPQIIVDRAFSFVTSVKSLSADVATGIYGTNQVITLSLTFSDEVALSGTTPPSLKINTGTVVPYATGSSTRTLVFIYIVKDGESTSSLGKFDDNAVVCTAPACRIINYNAQSVSLSLTGISLSPLNIVVDTSAPEVVSVYTVTLAPVVNGGFFVVGDVIEIVVKMNLEVFIDPPPSAYPEKAPLLLLNTVKGGKPILCRGYANDDRRLLLFKYVVELGDVASGLTYVSQSALTLNSGQCSIKRFSTTPTTDAVLTLPVPAPLGVSLNVDTTKVPTILSVTSPDVNAIYRSGDRLTITVSFSQHVVVKGGPFLWLDMGTASRKAVYELGSRTTMLTFIYTVQEDDYSMDMEYVDHHSLDASTSVSDTVPTAILHMSTNPTTLADVNLPYPFTQGSLGYNKNIQVNGRKPSITSVRFVSADGLYSVAQTVVMEMTFSSCVIIDRGPLGAQGPLPRLRFQPSPVSSLSSSAATTITRYGVYVSGSPGTALRFEYTIKTGDTARSLDYADTTALDVNGARILTCTANTNVAPTQNVDLHLNPPGGRLLGTTVKPVTFGKATFTDLVVDRLGFDYRVMFYTLYEQSMLETTVDFDMLSSAVYGLRSSPYASGDNLGSSVDIDGNTLVLGGPGASEPIAAVQVVTALGDSKTFVNEIQVLETTAKQQPAVQVLTSTAAPGETIGGWFYLKLGFVGPTRRLPFNADPVQVSVAMELDLGFDPQTISVSRELNTYCACSNGYVWYITFLYAEGPLEALVAISTQLTGRLVSIGDGRGGNTTTISIPSTNLDGTMALQRGNFITRNIRCNVDEADLSTILTQDLHLNVWSISRTVSSAMNTYTWSITFTASDTLYDVPQLTPQGVLLTGYGAGLTVRTERNGQGRLSGSFRLRFRTDLFPNDETDDISVSATDHDVEVALEKLVSVNDVIVQRTTSMNAFGGFSWTVTFVQVNTKNDYGPVVDTSGNLPALVPVTTKLQGTNARVVIQAGGYEPSALTADGLGTNWGIPGGSAGMVAVFTRGNYNDWKQQGGTIEGKDTRGGDLFGTSVSVQGNTLVVGAPAAAIFGDFERQSLLCDANGGYLRLSFNGETSTPIAFDAGMQDLQAAIADMMSVSYGEVQIDTSFTSLCAGVEVIITLRAGDHGDNSGNIPDIVVDSSALTKSGGVGSAQMHEYSAGTFRGDGVNAKGMQCGAAYIFMRDAVQSTWSQQAKIVPPTGLIGNISEFGASVSFSYPFAVVGAPSAFNEEGRAFVYQCNGAGVWSLFQTLSAAPQVITSGDRFGEAVAVSGSTTTTVAVGAPGYATDSGAVFVFDLVGGYFQSRQMLLQESPVMAPGDRFGNALDLDMFSTYTLVVGAHRHTFRRVGAIDAVDNGLALVFTRRSSNDILFALQQVLYGSDTRANDRFGTSVAVAKDTIVVGAHELYEGARTIRKPVQAITTSVLDSETTGIIQGGFFVLSFLQSNAGEDPTSMTTLKRMQTQSIVYDINPSGLEAILERDFEMTNIIVRRDGPSTSKEYTWYVTFADSSGEIPLLEADTTELLGAEVTVTQTIRMAPVLRGTAYAFTRDANGKWTEQASLFPRKKQYFAWFGSAVAVDKRTAIVGAPNLDTYVTGTNSGGGFVFDLGILSLRFSSKTYNVLEGDKWDVAVQRCSSYGAFCAIDVSAAPQLYINYDTGDAFSDRQSGPTYVAVDPQVGPYRKMSMLDAAGRQGSASVFFAKDVAGQEPFPQMSKGRWLTAESVGTANGRNQFYGSRELRSLWVDALFDYAGTSDYCSSTGVLYFDGMDDPTHTFLVLTTSDYVVETPDETVMLRLSLPGIWPSVTGGLWSTLTIRDNGDGGSGARSYLSHLNADPSLAQSYSDFSIAVSAFSAGNVAVVGAPLEVGKGGVKCGAVHFFVRRSGFWERDATIFPSDCAPNMRFGTSVAIDGSLGPVRAIVGAPGADAAYIYLYSKDSLTPATRWTEEVRLNEPSAATVDISHNYGGSNAISIFGDVSVVGASGLERVFVYHRGISGLWGLATTLRASDSVQYQILERTVEQEYAFGQALDMDRRTIIVGAPFSDGGAFTAQQYHSADFDRRFFGRGAVYIFHLESQEQIITLRTSSPLISGSFRLTATRRGVTGTTREIGYGSTAAEIKAALEGTDGRDGDGSTIEALGFRLLEVTRTGMIDQGFSWSVTFIGEILVIPVLTATWSGYGCTSCKAFSSSYATDPSRQVAVSETVAIGSKWRQQTRIMAPDGNPGDQFGFSVAISGEQTIVGAASSSALTSTTWDFETGDLTGWLTTGTAFDQQPTYGDNSYARINTYRPYQYPGAAPPGQSAHHEGRYWVGTFEARTGAGKATTAAQRAAQMCAFANDELCRAPNYKLPSASAPAGTTQGDGPQGTLISLPFTIEGLWMSFRVGGGCDVRVVYVELLIDGQSAAVPETVAAEQIAVEVTSRGSTTKPTNTARPVSATSKLRATGRCDEAMQEVTWDLSAFQNRSAQIRVVDASSSVVWGHINFDDVRFSWGATRVAQVSTSKAGEAYTFRRRAPGTQFPTAKCEGMNRWYCEWEFQARLIASDKRGEDRFGFNVAVDDTTGLAVISAPGQRAVDANNTIEHILTDGLDASEEGLTVMEEVGSVYVYRRADEVRDGAGVLLRTPRWTPKEVLKMQYPQKQRQSRFGTAISLDNSDLVVGAPGISISPVLPQAGRAFAYDLAVAGVRFTNPWFACIEGNADGLVGLTLSRSAATSNLTRALTIGYATEDRSAVGVDAMKFAACLKIPSTQRKDCGDYQQIAGEVTFAAGETSKLVTIPIMEDTCFEQWEEHFVVRLHVPGGEPLLGEHFIARVRIDDDDFNGEAC